MAKKKTNKFFKFYAKFGVLLIVALAVATVLTAALAAITKTVNDTTTTYNGFEVAFGKTIEGASADLFGIASVKTTINFSFLALCAYFLPLVGAIVCLLCLVLSKSKSVAKIGGLVACLLFITAAVLAFIIPNFTSFTFAGTSLLGSGSTSSTFANQEFSLGVGSILAGVVNIIGALASLIFVASKN